MGMPPPTAASNSSGTPVRSAAAISSGPRAAISSLLAVTTGFPGLQRGEDEVAGRVTTTHHLDDERHLGVADDFGRMGGHQVGRELEVAGLVGIPHRHPPHLEIEPCLGEDGGVIVHQPADDGTADRAGAENPDTDGVDRGFHVGGDPNPRGALSLGHPSSGRIRTSEPIGVKPQARNALSEAALPGETWAKHHSPGSIAASAPRMSRRPAPDPAVAGSSSSTASSRRPARPRPVTASPDSSPSTTTSVRWLLARTHPRMVGEVASHRQRGQAGCSRSTRQDGVMATDPAVGAGQEPEHVRVSDPPEAVGPQRIERSSRDLPEHIAVPGAARPPPRYRRRPAA